MRVSNTIVVVGLALGLASCSNSAATAPSQIIGDTVSAADNVLPEDASYLIQDASPLFDEEPSFSFTQDLSDTADWTVIAACASAESLETSSVIEIAVVPNSVVDDTIIERARAGAFSQAVACDFSWVTQPTR